MKEVQKVKDNERIKAVKREKNKEKLECATIKQRERYG